MLNQISTYNNQNLKETKSLTPKKDIIMKNMKLLIAAVLFLSININSVFAQSGNAKPTVKEIEYNDRGQFEIQAGIGLMSTFVSPNASTRILPVNVVLNYRVNKAFNLGAYFGHSSYEFNDINNDKDHPTDVDNLYLRNDFYLVGLRAEGHFNRERVDFYGGAMLGYNFSRINTNIEDSKNRPEGIEIAEDSAIFTYSGYVGLKYALTPKVGVYGEIGYGVSLITVGASYRF